MKNYVAALFAAAPIPQIPVKTPKTPLRQPKMSNSMGYSNSEYKLLM